MPLNPYFNFMTEKSPQDVMESLIIQSIQMYGMDIKYMPMTNRALDLLVGEDPSKEFTSAFVIEMYMENADGFGGNLHFLNKLGYNMDKEIMLMCSMKRFTDVTSMQRPKEGDWIYFPLTNDIFEVNFVDHEEPGFYQLGKIYTWKLTCVKINYSQEKVSTGDSEIDNIARELENNDSVSNDPTADNNTINSKILDFLDPTDQKNPLKD